MVEIDAGTVKKVVVACDAGMGSSVMVAAQLEGKLKPYSVSVAAASIEEIPQDADLVLCQDTLLARAREDSSGKVVLGFHNFLGDPVFDEVETAIRDGGRLGC